MNQIEFLGCPMHSATIDETVGAIDRRIQEAVFTQHVVVNVAKLISMRKDVALRHSVQSCDIINIDGKGVVWGARFCGHRVPERVAGIDLFNRLLDLAEQKKYPVFFLGARQAIVQTAVSKIQCRHPNLPVAGFHHGYFWENERAVVDEIAESGARLLFVAISSPKKENFINQWRDALNVNFVMGVGGTFDVVAGKTKRAPEWMQKYGLEWFYRFLQEPHRMWRRYLTTNTVYAFEVVKEKIKTA